MKKIIEKSCAVLAVLALCYMLHPLLGGWTWLVGGIGLLAVAMMHGEADRVFASLRRKRKQSEPKQVNLRKLLDEQIGLTVDHLNGDPAAEEKLRKNEKIFEQGTGTSLGDD